MAHRILGIDIGSYSVKIAEFERSLKAFELVGFYEQPVIAGDVLTPLQSAAAALKKLVEDYNLAGASCWTALPGQLTSTRVLELPFSNFKKIDSTIEFEMENYVPFPLEDLLIDYHIVSSGKNQSEILVAYAKQSDFVPFLSALGEVDLDPSFVGCEPVELGNVMRLGVAQPEGAYALLDLGHTKTNVAIFVGPRLHSARTIMRGGRDLTAAIAAKLKVPVEEAEKLKVEIGQAMAAEGADAMTLQVSQAIEEVLDGLLVELKQTFSGFQEKTGHVVQAVYLCGGTSRLAGIDQYLIGGLKKNVSSLDCLDFPFNRLGDSDWCRPIAPLAVGLAYRGAAGGGFFDIQFRRGEFAYRGDVQQVASLVRQVGVSLALIFLMAMGSFAINYFILKAGVNRAKTQVVAVAEKVFPEAGKKSLENPRNVLSLINGRIAELEERKKKLDEELTGSPLVVLEQISSALPPKDAVSLDVDNLSISGGRIRMEGRTGTFEAVDRVKEALTRSPYFQNVATGNVRKGTKNDIKFDISFELKTEEARGA